MSSLTAMAEDSIAFWLAERAKTPNERPHGKSRLDVDAECAALGYWVLRDDVQKDRGYRTVNVVCKNCRVPKTHVPLHTLKPCRCAKGVARNGRPLRTDYSEFGKKVVQVLPGNRRRVQCLHCGHLFDQARSSLTRTPCPKCGSGGEGRLWCWATHDGFGWGNIKPLNVERSIAVFTGADRYAAIDACRNPRSVCACDPLEALQFWATMNGKEFTSC